MSALAGAWTEGGSTITFHFGMGMYCFLTSVLAPKGVRAAPSAAVPRRHGKVAASRRVPTTSDSTRQGVSTELSSGPESRWCWIPPRLHTPTVAIPAGQRVGSPASTGARTQTSVRIPCGRGRRPPTRFVCAGHRPATREPEDRQNRAVSIPPPGMGEGPLTAFPQVRGPLTHSVAGEGFEPSKLSRWIYSPKAANL